jgi:hypothetical protein
MPWFVRNDVIRETLGAPTLHYFTVAAADQFAKAAASSFLHIAAIARREGAPEVFRPKPAAILDIPP